MALDEIARFDAVAKSVEDESYQKRAPDAPYTQYALGAMQEVGPEYTRISIEEAERVGKQLKSGLTAMGLTVDFRLQGSVPANIHIRGVSDVDLLTIDDAFFFLRYQRSPGARGNFQLAHKLHASLGPAEASIGSRENSQGALPGG